MEAGLFRIRAAAPGPVCRLGDAGAAGGTWRIHAARDVRPLASVRHGAAVRVDDARHRHGPGGLARTSRQRTLAGPSEETSSHGGGAEGSHGVREDAAAADAVRSGDAQSLRPSAIPTRRHTDVHLHAWYTSTSSFPSPSVEDALSNRRCLDGEADVGIGGRHQSAGVGIAERHVVGARGSHGTIHQIESRASRTFAFLVGRFTRSRERRSRPSSAGRIRRPWVGRRFLAIRSVSC
mmetsp:Transcript_7228/g.45108  ORF Transcript_7228/g.45108 Transcript_7228/m.45108 type:complete len:236 (+) Transcript_7228:450-1157(+)